MNRPLVLPRRATGNLDPNTSVDIMRLLDKVNRIGDRGDGDPRPGDRRRDAQRVIELDKGLVVRDQSRGVYS